MKTSKSHSRGDHVMERFHRAKHSFFGSWRCQPCVGDFVSPVSRAQKRRGQKKDLNDRSFDSDFVKSDKKVLEKEDRKDPNFDPEFVKSSQTAPAREDRKDPNFTKGSQPTAAKKYRKDRSLRSFMNDSQEPKAREDHLLLENQSWRKEEDVGDAEGNRKGESKSPRGKINEQLQPTPLEAGNEMNPEDKNVKNLEGKNAAVPSPTDIPQTESLNPSKPVNNTTLSDEAGIEETQRKGSQSHQGEVNGEVQSKSQEDRNELKPEDKNVKNLEGKDAAVPSPTDLPETESLKHSEPVNNTTISDEAGIEESQRKGSQSHQGEVNGEVQSNSQEDRNELKPEDKNVKNLEGKDAAVPSPTDLPETESLKHSEPVNNTTISDEAGIEESQRKGSQSHQGEVNGEVQSNSQEDRNELKPEDKNVKNLEGKDAAVPSPTDLPETESLKHSEPVNNTTISDEAGIEETQRKGSQSHQGEVNGEVQSKSQEDRNELKPEDKNVKNLEGKDAAVPSPTDLPETESLKHSEPVNNTTISDEAGIEESQRKGSQSHQGEVNGEVQSKSQEDRNELKPEDKNVKNLEGKDAAVPSPTDLPETESLKHSEPVNNTTISDEAGIEETQRKGSQSHQGEVNGEVQSKSQEDRNELKPEDKNVKNLEGKDAAVPSPTDLPETESLKHSEPVNNTTISDEAAIKETQRKGSQSHQGEVNGEVQSKSREDRNELKPPNEDMESLEEKDAAPSHTCFAKSESLDQAEQVRNSSVSGEVVGKENEQGEDSPSQRADMNGQLPPTSQPDEQELKVPEEIVGNFEETDAVPSHHSLSNILPIIEFLEHLERDSKATFSDKGTRDGDIGPPDGPQGQSIPEGSKNGTHSVMQCAPEKDSRHAKHLKAESVEELDPGHNNIPAHLGAQGEAEHHLDSPPPEYLKQFSQTSEGEDGGKSVDMLIQYWEEKRKHHPEDVVPEGKFQHSGSQKLECPKEFSKADPNRLSRGSRSRAEHLESPHNQGNLSKQSSDIDTAGQNTNIPHSESYESPQEAEGEKVTPANLNGLHQTQNEIFGASSFREAEQEWDSPELDDDGLHSAGDEKPGGSEDADPNHPLNNATDEDAQHKRQASQSVMDMHKGNSVRPSSASSEDEFQHQEGNTPGETKYAPNSDRHQEMEGKKIQDGLHDKETQNGDQEDHYSRNTGLLPLNLEDLHRAKGTKSSNAGSEDRFEHQDDPDHGKDEKMQDSFIEKRIHGGTSDPEECFPNSENLEEFLTRNGYKKGASNSAHGDGSSISSSHDQGKAGSKCLWDRVSTHDIGEDKTGHIYRDHSQHIGHSHRAEHSHHTGLPDHTDHGEEAAQAEQTSAWKLGFFSVPHIVVVGALTALSVLGKAAN